MAILAQSKSSQADRIAIGAWHRGTNSDVESAGPNLRNLSYRGVPPIRAIGVFRIAGIIGNSSVIGTILAVFVAKSRKVAIAVVVQLC